MGSAGGEAKKGQEGGGGGMPSLPQIPQQQKTPQKSEAELLAEQKAKRAAECASAVTTYNNGVLSCDASHPCRPQLARVKDVCDAYNDCLKALAPVPGDCPNAPTPATPK
jgi:hypothetical protein